MINRRHLLGIVPLAATLLLAGCAADSQTEQGQAADGLRAIHLTATVGDGARADTRAATGIQSAQFDQGETFYAYFPSGVSVGNVSTASGTMFTTTNTSGATTPETQPYFNADASSVNVYAYYPQTVTEAANQKFSVDLDQSGDEGYKASDLMYATTTVSVDKSSASSATGLLTFSHKMSKIIVSATAGAGITAIQQVRIVGGKKSITIVNPMTTDENTSPFFGSTPSLSDAITTADNGCVKLYNHATGEATVSCAGLIPPQTIASGTTFLEVVTDVGTATYSLASAKTFAPGESYAYSISLTLASIGITTAINDWTAAGTTELENNGTATLLPPDPGVALASATVGMIVGSNGKAYDVSYKDNLPSGVTAVAVVGYKSGSNGYALALVDASDQTWNEITNSGENKNVDCTLSESKRGSVPAAPTGTAWKVLNKANYEAVFVAMGSTTGDSDGKTYDTNVNSKITAAGGSGLSGLYWSSQEGSGGNGWDFNDSYWTSSSRKDTSLHVRPALAW